jgi:manganese/zinc/iron transport system substrate-binding protein
MGPGVDPHTYKATPSDVRKLNAADVVFYNGMHLEGRLADLLVAMARKKPTFAVTEGLQQSADSRLREPPEFAGHYDPHVWHDAALWSECVRYAADKLMEIDAAHREAYQTNRDAYIVRLTELHEEAKRMVSTVDKDRRVLVTAHDAFGYFGQAYDVEVHGLQGISTVDEPDVASMERLVSMLVDRQIKAVFVESSVPPRNVQALVEACAAQGHEVRIGGELFSDAMGEVGTPEGTYVGMFRHNVLTVVEALK